MSVQLELPLEEIKINYIVKIKDTKGDRALGCANVEEVYSALGSGSFGALTSVSSPAGLDVSQFVSF